MKRMTKKVEGIHRKGCLPLFFSFGTLLPVVPRILEREIVFWIVGIASCRSSSRGSWSRRRRNRSYGSRRSLCWGWRWWEGRISRCSRYRRISRGGIIWPHIIGTDGIVPSSLVFTRIDVEEHLKVLSLLNIEASQPIFAKDRKHHFLRVLLDGFQHKLTHFPITPGAGTATLRQHENNFSYYIHCKNTDYYK